MTAITSERPPSDSSAKAAVPNPHPPGSSPALRTKTYISILLIIALNPLGNVLLGAGMKRVGPLTSSAPLDLFHFFFHAITTGTVWLGIGALLLFFVAYLIVLSWADYSYVQ